MPDDLNAMSPAGRGFAKFANGWKPSPPSPPPHRNASKMPNNRSSLHCPSPPQGAVRGVPAWVAAALFAALISGCATTKAGPELLLPADESIDLARASGAVEQAPLELAEAVELRAQAQALVDDDKGRDAAAIAERAALQARLALARAEGSAARAELEQARAEFDRLVAALRETFGDALVVPGAQP